MSEDWEKLRRRNFPFQRAVDRPFIPEPVTVPIYTRKGERIQLERIETFPAEDEKMAEDTLDELESEARAREMMQREIESREYPSRESAIQTLAAGRYARGKPFPARMYEWPQASRIPEPMSAPPLEPKKGQKLYEWRLQVMQWQASRPPNASKETCGSELERLKRQRETEDRKSQREAIDSRIRKLRKCVNYGSPVPE